MASHLFLHSAWWAPSRLRRPSSLLPLSLPSPLPSPPHDHTLNQQLLLYHGTHAHQRVSCLICCQAAASFLLNASRTPWMSVPLVLCVFARFFAAAINTCSLVSRSDRCCRFDWYLHALVVRFRVSYGMVSDSVLSAWGSWFVLALFPMKEEGVGWRRSECLRHRGCRSAWCTERIFAPW